MEVKPITTPAKPGAKPLPSSIPAVPAIVSVCPIGISSALREVNSRLTAVARESSPVIAFTVRERVV